MEVLQYHAKMQVQGRREGFALQTNNKAEAADKARGIYLQIVTHGWDSALKRFKPQAVRSKTAIRTVGELVAAAQERATLQPRTLAEYCSNLRRLVSEALGISTRIGRRPTSGSKQKEWRERVHAARLSDLTPDVVERWKKAYLVRAGTDPLKRRHASTSLNTIIRNAKSLFSTKVTQFLEFDPDFKSPFQGVSFEPRQSMKYRSEVKLPEILEWAFNGNEERKLPALPIEQLKILLLAAIAGLRRNEIDKLMWTAFRWDAGVLRIEATAHFDPKTEESLADVRLDPELLTLFRQWERSRTSEFVIESATPPRSGLLYSHYRCRATLAALVAWLKQCGITSDKPIHVLRKEYGSQICARYGIFVASKALRHADIHITSQHYLDQNTNSKPGLGFMLAAHAHLKDAG
jgi:integrase